MVGNYDRPITMHGHGLISLAVVASGVHV